MSETGSVKFKCEQVAAQTPGFDGFDELNRCRRRLLDLGMIGTDESGIGFGNLSVRDGSTSRFYITGSGTGGIGELAPADCAKVVAYDFAKNWLRCEGARIASSESLTHAAVYESDPGVCAVIHCHNTKLWGELLDKVPATPKGFAYGTPEMAHAVKDLFESSDLKRKKIFVMASHIGGLVAFGRDMEEAFGTLKGEMRKIGFEGRRKG